jgi:tRNA(adenine34) deaminase
MADIDHMRAALALAGRAKADSEVPVGAIVIYQDEVIGEGWNRAIATCDPTAHAEVVAIRAAAQRLGNYRLPRSTLYVTLEPCAMCAGAIIHARIARVVFGAFDRNSGAAGSVIDVLLDSRSNHAVDVFGGVLADECGSMLRGFFAPRRK